VTLGSRDAARAGTIASECSEEAKRKYGRGMLGSIKGAQNADAVAEGNVVIAAIPSETLQGFLDVSQDYQWHGQILLSPIVPFEKKEGLFVYKPFLVDGETLSAAQMIQRKLGTKAFVVAGLHCVPAARLLDLSYRLGYDVPLAGHRESAYTLVELLNDAEGLRPLYAGPLSLSFYVESLMPLLLNIAVRNKLREPSIRIVANE
jgi:hypothetical protein